MAQARQVAVVKRGDVYIVELDPTRVSELKKTRPTLIIQNDVDNCYSPITVIAPITSKFDATLYPTEVQVKPPESGTRRSVAVGGTVDVRRAPPHMASVTGHHMRHVRRQLADYQATSTMGLWWFAPPTCGRDRRAIPSGKPVTALVKASEADSRAAARRIEFH